MAATVQVSGGAPLPMKDGFLTMQFFHNSPGRARFGRSTRWLRIGSVALFSLTLGACGTSQGPTETVGVTPDPETPTPPELLCSMNHFPEADAPSIVREPGEAPLADLSHYQARNAAVDPAAVLNSGNCAGNISFTYATGVGDISGPAAGSSMAGYADTAQVTTGMIDRQHARAFIFRSQCDGRDGRALIIQTDLGLMFHSVSQGVLDAIAADPDLSPLYGFQNVMINASHSHATAGGQSHFDAFHVLTGGHDAQNLQAVIDGVMVAVRRAHANLATATAGPVRFNQAELLNGTVQRSLPAYLNNPEAERAAFVDTNGDEVQTNRMMSLLRLQRFDGTAVGMLNWYPIHGTSISQLSTQLSGDNKGYAAYRFEQDFDTNYFAEETFLAGFLQADEGDASPNVFITDLTEPQLRDKSSPEFLARAGGRETAFNRDSENALISGLKQYQHALDLYNNANEFLIGEVQSAALFIDFTNVPVDSPRDYPPELQPTGPNGFTTCRHALGVSFGGGAEDGRGPSDEGATCTNTSDQDAASQQQQFEDAFAAGQAGALPPQFVALTGCNSPALQAAGYNCHEEKPILFPVAEASPSANAGNPGQSLEPGTLKVQLTVIGNLAIIALPWEVTTMSGRRVRNAVLDVLETAGVDYAVISGLTNGYIHYMTTREEYATQQYEGASTVYGPWTQEAAQQELVRMATQLRDGDPVTSPFEDPNFRSAASTLVNPANASDGNNPGANFGGVVQQPEATYQIGADAVVVTASFIAGHPRNDLRLESSYIFVERENAAGQFEVVQTDADWFTRLTYAEQQQDGTNHAVIEWVVPVDAEPGTYRIRHEGASAQGAHSGVTNTFELLACAN